MHETYLNLFQALLHASVACSLKPSIQWIAASDLEDATAINVSH
jgi:CTP synthase